MSKSRIESMRKLDSDESLLIVDVRVITYFHGTSAGSSHNEFCCKLELQLGYFF